MAKKNVELEQERVLNEFLGDFFNDEPIGLEHIQGLIDWFVPEGIRIDFKAAKWVDEKDGLSGIGHPPTYTGKIKKWLSGFANAIGGALVIGVAERKDGDRVVGYKLDPVPWSREMAEKDTVQGMKALHPYLKRPYRCAVVEVQQGRTVIVVGVGRADKLVPVVEEQQLVYYLRIHDNTVHAPAYLVEDLLLGSKQRVDYCMALLSSEVGSDAQKNPFLHLKLRLENIGTRWIDDVSIGIVHEAKGVGDGNVNERIADSVDQTLIGRLANFRTRQSIAQGRSPRALLRYQPFENTGPDGDRPIAPFVSHTFYASKIEFPNGDDILWYAALLVSPRNETPTWHQLIVRYQNNMPQWGSVLSGLPFKPLVGSRNMDGCDLSANRCHL